MADTAVPAPAPPRKRRWLRVLGWIFSVLIVLLVVVYFVATSSAFLKGVILPRAGKAMNATITVSDASISPFKEVVLRNLKVQTTGDEPLVAVSEVRTRYSLMDIIRGNIHVDEVTVSSPTVVLIENPDGSSNLDPILKSQKETPGEKKPERPSKPSAPLQIDLKKLSLTDATVRQVKIHKDGGRETSEISHLNVTLANLKNGKQGTLQLGADIRSATAPPKPGTNSVLDATLKGDFSFAMTPALKPSSLKGSTRLAITRADGAMSDLTGLAIDLNSEVTPTEIKQVALAFEQGGTKLGEVRVHGPLDSEKLEGRLSVEVAGIDKKVLNILGAKNGIDFGTTTIESTNEIQLANAGSTITASGQFDANKVQVIRTNQATQPLDFRIGYNVTVDTAHKNALLRNLKLVGLTKGAPFLNGDLTSPMNLSWGGAATAVGDSALNITVTGFNLADWRAFLGHIAPEGEVNVKAKLMSQQGGKKLTFDVTSQIDKLTVGEGSNQIAGVTVNLDAAGTAADFERFDLTSYAFKVSREKQPVVTVSGAGKYDAASQAADMQVAVQAASARLLQMKPQPDVNLSSGSIELKARVTQTAATGKATAANQTVTGSLSISDLSGRIGKNELRALATSMELHVTKAGQQVQIKDVKGSLSESGKPGGSFNISGAYDLDRSAGSIKAVLTDFNQDGLGPFLEPLLADKKLVSIAINGTINARYDPNGDSSVGGGVQVTNLVVRDPKEQFPATPLEAKLQFDASLRKQVADIRQLQVNLTPTERAKNEIQFAGHVDMSQTNAIQGFLKLASDSLDLTRYYDLFAGQKKPTEKKPAQTAKPAVTAETPSPSVSTGQKEPDAVNLPLRNFTVDVQIGHIYLREIDISNMQSEAKINGGHVLLNPFKLILNGAPVNSTADLDLGVPGYKYDVAFGADRIPLAPLVNTFQPDRKGQIGGTLFAQAKLKGAGTTGASLQKTLTGNFDINSTNLNLSVVNVRSRLLKTLVNVIAAIPELVKNPASAVGSIFGGGGLMSELSKSPIEGIVVRGTAGNGRLDLQQAHVQSAAFLAEAAGNVAIAEVLSNSVIQIPVQVYLSHAIAANLDLASPGNEPYSKFPDFLTMKGTVGDPKADINKAALGGVALKAIGSVVSGAGGKSGSLIQGVGNLLTGNPPATTNASTNQFPSSNQPLNNLLNNFLKPKKK